MNGTLMGAIAAGRRMRWDTGGFGRMRQFFCRHQWWLDADVRHMICIRCGKRDLAQEHELLRARFKRGLVA
jgi:hypothetical protein